MYGRNSTVARLLLLQIGLQFVPEMSIQKIKRNKDMLFHQETR